jgi:hypothetical protein
MPSSEEDDYLTMAIPVPSVTKSRKTESLTEKNKRVAREREAKARTKSKAELAVEAKRKREEGLQRNILLDTGNGEAHVEGGVTQSKGAAMMAKLGYKPGTALGKATNESGADGVDARLLEPIGISEREGRGGIGADAERKRKIREEFAEREEGVKKVKVDMEEYRERQAREREEVRKEGLLRGAMGVAERLEEEDDNEDGGRDVAGTNVKVPRKHRRLQDIPVLWRSLPKQRQLTERDRRMRYDLHESLSKRADYNDPEEEREDRIAMGKKETEEVDRELDCEDKELNEFEALEVGERLERLIGYLRERWRYCFWCKYRYADEGMEGCPGVREEDHD